MRKFLLIVFMLIAGVNINLHANQSCCENPVNEVNSSVPEFFIGAVTFYKDMPELHYQCTISLSNYEQLDMFSLPIASYLFVDPDKGRIEFTIENEMMMRYIYNPYKEQGYYNLQVPIRGYDYSTGGTPWPTVSRIGIIRIIFGD